MLVNALSMFILSVADLSPRSAATQSSNTDGYDTVVSVSTTNLCGSTVGPWKQNIADTREDVTTLPVNNIIT